MQDPVSLERNAWVLRETGSSVQPSRSCSVLRALRLLVGCSPTPEPVIVGAVGMADGVMGDGALRCEQRNSVTCRCARSEPVHMFMPSETTGPPACDNA